MHIYFEEEFNPYSCIVAILKKNLARPDPYTVVREHQLGKAQIKSSIKCHAEEGNQ